MAIQMKVYTHIIHTYTHRAIQLSMQHIEYSHTYQQVYTLLKPACIYAGKCSNDGMRNKEQHEGKRIQQS